MVLSIAYRNIRKHWHKSLATILAISCSVVAQTLFVGYISRANLNFEGIFSFKQMLGDVVIEDQRRLSPEGKDEPLKFALPKDVSDKIKTWADSNPNVISYVRFLNFTGMIANGQSQLVAVGQGHDFGTSEKMRGAFSWNAYYGEPLERVKVSSGALLGTQLGEWLKCTPDTRIQLHPDVQGYPPIVRPFHCLESSFQITALTESDQINSIDVIPVGLTNGGVREIDNRLVITDLDSAQSLLHTDKVSYGTLRWKDHNDLSVKIDSLKKFLSNINTNLIATKWSDHEYGRLYKESISLLDVFQNFIVIVALIITGMSVFNTSLKSVMERSKEIGTLLCLGFEKWKIQAIFLSETVLLALIGNFIGTLIGILLSTFINSLNIEYRAGLYTESYLLYIQIIPFTYLLASLITLATSFVTTFFTTQSYLRRRIVQNLND